VLISSSLIADELRYQHVFLNANFFWA
jgi:hypothetical protein